MPPLALEFYSYFWKWCLGSTNSSLVFVHMYVCVSLTKFFLILALLLLKLTQKSKCKRPICTFILLNIGETK